MNFYCYNNWHCGDNLFIRPLVIKLIELGHRVIIGCRSSMRYLFLDLEKKGVSIIDSTVPDINLETLCPPNHTKIDTWLGRTWRTGKFIGMSWKNMIEVFNEQSPDVTLEYTGDVPLLDFNTDVDIYVPKKAIYLDNTVCTGPHSNFNFNIEHISKTFTNLNFVCTGNPRIRRGNILDYSSNNLVELSIISEKCLGILGKGSGPYVCTITSKYINKPRALCGITKFFLKPCWPHSKDITKFLNTMDEVFDFIKSIETQI